MANRRQEKAPYPDSVRALTAEQRCEVLMFACVNIDQISHSPTISREACQMIEPVSKEMIEPVSKELIKPFTDLMAYYLAI